MSAVPAIHCASANQPRGVIVGTWDFRAVSQPNRRVRFYRTESRDVVRDELRALDVNARADLLAAMARRKTGKQFAHEDEQVKGRIRAIRSTTDGREYRLLYATVGQHDQVYLGLHALEKKRTKLQKSAIKIAESRLGTWEEAHTRRVTGRRRGGNARR